MKNTFYLLCLMISLSSCLGADCPIDFCNSTIPSKDLVEKLCDEKTGVMEERCCFYNDSVIGVDLRFCLIHQLNILSSNLTRIQIMDLRDNDLGNISISDLKGLADLDELYLPLQVACPGGNSTWNSIHSEGNMTACLGQINPCISLNISCTENGECLHTGPGTAKCVCIPGHHGYKCMIEGVFPVEVFQISLFATTFALCGILWFVVGRDAKRKIANS